MSGYGAREGRSTGVHDPLLAAALVVSDGATTVGVVSVDLLNVSERLVRRVREHLDESGVALDELVVAATHTHAGPHVPAPALEMEPLLRVDADERALVDDVEADLAAGVAAAVERAHGRRESATLRVGTTTLDGVQHNRRASGGVGGNVRMPTGEVDPSLDALVVETRSGREAVAYGFACHPVCTTPDETRLSADWPGYARRRVREERPDADVLFFNGAAGDINPRGSDEAREDDAVYEYTERVGETVGDAVGRAIADAESRRDRADPPVVAARRSLALPLKRVPSVDRLDTRLDDLRGRMDDCEAAGDRVGLERTEWDYWYVRTLRGIAEWGARSLPAPLPYVEVGGVGLVGVPGEAFAEHGRRLKTAATADVLLPVGYANGYVGYLPTLAEFENGGYEVRSGKVSVEGVLALRRAALDLVSAPTHDHRPKW